MHELTPEGVPVPGVLWTISPNLVLFMFLYTAVGTFCTTTVFGKRLMQLDYRVLKKAGDLRFSLLRTRENSGRHTSQPRPACCWAACALGVLEDGGWLRHQPGACYVLAVG